MAVAVPQHITLSRVTSAHPGRLQNMKSHFHYLDKLETSYKNGNESTVRQHVRTKTLPRSSWVSGSSFHLYQYSAHRRLKFFSLFVALVGFLCGTTGILLAVFLGHSQFVAMIAPSSLCAAICMLWLLSALGFTANNPIVTCLASPEISDVMLSMSLFTALRSRHATDPKDRAYAFYGVLERLGVEITESNYGKSVNEIYLDLFKGLIASRWSITLLLDVGMPGLGDNPTWVPDWSARKEWFEDYAYQITRQTATPGSESLYELHPQGILSVRGSHHDVIIFCSNNFHASNNLNKHDPESPQRFFGYNARVVLQALSRIKYHARLLGPEETLSNGVYELIHARTTARIEEQHRILFEAWYSVIAEITIETNDLEEQILIYGSKLAHNSPAMQYHNQLCSEMAEKRVFFVTSNRLLWNLLP
jgi:hypothetical protein